MLLGVSVTRIPGSTRGVVNFTTVEEVQVDCPVGSWCTAGRIIPCVQGTYNRYPRQTSVDSCTYCPEGATTVVPASTQLEDCVCAPGYYNRNPTGLAVRASDCVPCVAGTDCQHANITVAKLPILPGWFRYSPNSTDVRKCEDFNINANCSADELMTICYHTTSGCQGTLDEAQVSINVTVDLGDNLTATYQTTDVVNLMELSHRDYADIECAPTLYGPFCQLCLQWDEYDSQATTMFNDEVYYYQRADSESKAECKPCRLRDRWTSIATITSMCLFFLLILWLSKKLLLMKKRSGGLKQKSKFAKRIEKGREIFARVELGAKLKQAWEFMVMVSLLEDVYQLSLPATVQTTTRTVSMVVMPINPKFFQEEGAYILQCLSIHTYANRALAFRAWMCMCSPQRPTLRRMQVRDDARLLDVRAGGHDRRRRHLQRHHAPLKGHALRREVVSSLLHRGVPALLGQDHHLCLLAGETSPR